MYTPESYFLYHFFGIGKVVFCTTVKEYIFTAATSKMRARNCTTRELFLYHLRGAFLPPKSGTVPDSLGGTVPGSLFALCFPIFGTNCAFLGLSWKLIEKPGGHIGGTVSGFLQIVCLWFSNITCFFVFCKPFLGSLVSCSFCVSFFPLFLLCCSCLVMMYHIWLICSAYEDTQNNKEEKEERKKERKKTRKEERNIMRIERERVKGGGS